VRAILDLTFNSNGKPVRLQEISERQKISLHYLEQLFRRLRKGNVVKSVRGPGGGYLLARSMDDIAVKDVLLSVGENINPARDIVGPADMKESTVEFVLTKTYFENLAVLMQEYLETTTLGDLIRKARGEQRTGVQPGAAATANIGAPAAEANRRVETDLS
jgi:Rrf2 family iron-sulfur cluster assembly transcriptional regulator